MSALRVDAKRSNDIQTYITLTSLDAWAKATGYRLRVLEPLPTAMTSSEEVVTTTARPKVRRKHREQEEAIVKEIVRLGYVPLGLPPRSSGKSGVKSLVRDALQENDPFGSCYRFDKAWDRLRAGKEIVEMVDNHEPAHKIRTLLPQKTLRGTLAGEDS